MLKEGSFGNPDSTALLRAMLGFEQRDIYLKLQPAYDYLVSFLQTVSGPWIRRLGDPGSTG
jgi:hypothetical protein